MNACLLDNDYRIIYDFCNMIQQLISDEKFTNIQKAQAGLTKLFTKAEQTKTFYRVLKNDKPLGVLIPENLWKDFVEDWEALSSPAYLAGIIKARSQKKRYTLSQVKKELNL